MPKKNGFTLIELLVVVAIIGILAAVGVVAYSGYTKSAKEKVCKANHDKIVKTIKEKKAFCEFESTIKLRTWYSGFKQGAEYDFNSNASNEEIVGLMKGITTVSKKLGISSIDGKGYRALANISDYGGQEVPHLHFHLFGGEKVGKMVL